MANDMPMYFAKRFQTVIKKVIYINIFTLFITCIFIMLNMTFVYITNNTPTIIVFIVKS